MEALVWVATGLAAAAAFFVYVVFRYVPIIVRGAFDVPHHRPPGVTPPPPGLKSHTSSFTDSLGRTFQATLIEAPRRTDRIVVFCHETAAGETSWAKHAGFLPGHGFDVVTFGYERGETYQWPSFDEWTAVEGALGWLYREKKGARVALFGVSKGAVLALAAARHFSVSAVVLDGAFSTLATLEGFMKKWISIYVRPDAVARAVPRWLLALLARITLAYAGLRLRRRFFSAEEHASKLVKPALFIHAENDSFATAADVERLRAQARGDTEAWIVPGAAHSGSAAACPEEYRSKIVAFLDRRLV